RKRRDGAVLARLIAAYARSRSRRVLQLAQNVGGGERAAAPGGSRVGRQTLLAGLAIALYGVALVAEVQVPANPDPKRNSTLNPAANASINPRATAAINPRSNVMINPVSNTLLNPERNALINPKINASINPKSNGTLDPRKNVLLDPINGRWS